MLISAHYFREIYAVVSTAVSIYKSDAIDGDSTGDIEARYGSSLNAMNVRFEFDRSDMPKKGWTRYYPVMIDEKRFIVRIFLTGEKVFQDLLPVLFEAEIMDPAVTCQILPDVDLILGRGDMRPYRPIPQRQSATSI